MGRWWPRVPREVRERVEGSVLAYARAEDGSVLAGTRDALWLLPAEGDSAVWPWEEVHHGDWDAESDTLRVVRTADWGEPMATWTVVVPEPGALPDLVRERVSASVLLLQRVEVAGRRGLSVVARRAPRGEGPVTWTFDVDEGVDPGDPDVAALAERALREAQAAVGLR